MNRGRAGLYGVAFAALAVSGLLLAVTSLDRDLNVKFFWASIVLSVVGIALAVASVVARKA
ncbi:MAG: hypothetical protein WD757_00760 [Actinomycetota bacterium]